MTKIASKIIAKYCQEASKFECGQGINLRICPSKTTYIFKENVDVETAIWQHHFNEIQKQLEG